MFIELHIIQNFAPSNLNRDDTNNPKDCEFGGARRARISSQCLKRSMRQAPIFKTTTQVEVGVRTRWLARLVRQALVSAGKPEAEATLVANAFSAQYAGKTDKVKDSDLERTSVLIYFSPQEIREIASGILENWEAARLAAANPDDKGAQKDAFASLVNDLVKSARGRTSAPDIALFGRMLANDPKLNLDAACQVAHAISTHRVNMEMDFFTAVDDLQESDETGAGMMGVTGFNSACFYRYARLDWELLLDNLDGDRELASRTVEAFLRAAVEAVPGGKQNSFAAHNAPSFLLAVVRQDGRSWSLANAFEQPVTPRREAGLVSRSVEALDQYWGRLTQVYGSQEVQPKALTVDPNLKLENLKDSQADTLKDWVSSVKLALAQG